jgi:acylphosphatase
MVAKQVFYSGRVQGVGFRYATRRLAAGFEVSGWVRNLPDGRVELLVVAADAGEAESFLTELQEHSELAGFIKQKEIIDITPPAGVRGFTILR